MAPTPIKFALVLGGGNALGAYHAGVYQALHDAGQEPDWIVGASAGAINGAVIAGNAPDERVARLHELWQPAASDDDLGWPFDYDTLRRTGSALATLGLGRPGLFGPVGPLGSWWNPDPAAAAPGLFDTKPMVATLRRLIDFDRLNRGGPRYTAAAVDLDSGKEALFDTARQTLAPDHVRASAALLPAFPAVEIAGRAYVDGGFATNLPLDPVLGAPWNEPTLVVAADLLPQAGRRPRTLGEAAARAQNLTFAAQSRRTVERWQMAYALDDRFKATSVSLVRLAYAQQEREVAGKAMDFSAESARFRWDAGHRDASAMLDRLADGTIPLGFNGLTVSDAEEW
jgi:NTE family protein